MGSKKPPNKTTWTPKLNGKEAIDRRLCQILLEAWRKGFTTKSDFAREFTDYVAIAACMGFITTRIFPPDVWGSSWQITSKGLQALEEVYGINTKEEDDDET